MVLEGRMERAIARILLPDWAKSGWSAARIIRGLKSAGATYRRTDMLGDIRQAQDRVTYGSKVVDFSAVDMPTKSVMSDSVFIRDRRYRVGFTSRVYYPETGAYKYEHGSMYMDSLDTKEGWSEKYLEEMNASEQYEGRDFQIAEVTFIEHNQGWDY